MGRTKRFCIPPACRLQDKKTVESQAGFERWKEEVNPMVLKWKLAFQLLWYRILIQIGLKGEEIYYIGGSEALPPPLTGKRKSTC